MNYRVYREYYEGKQKLAFATDKFKNTFGAMFKEFSENACRTVVDSLADRMKIEGFRTSQADIATEDVPIPMPKASLEQVNTPPARQKMIVKDPLAEALMTIWKDEKMTRKATKVHKEALRLGDAYVIVWEDGDGDVGIWPQRGDQCCVRYDDETGTDIEIGAKIWYDDRENRWYLNLYYPDGITKYQTTNTGRDVSRAAGSWETFQEVANPYGRVPIFHFPNSATCEYGVSELKDIVPLQDGLNKSVMDMMIAMEFASFKQRYVIGLEVEIDEETGEPLDPNAKNYGVDRLLAFADTETKVGEFSSTDLDQFLRVTDKFWTSIAKISGTPLHYFFITTGDFPSGNAMRAAEGKFVNKITDRQEDYGDGWAEVFKFASKVQGTDIDEEEVETAWSNAAQPSEAEIADTAVKKKAVGVSQTQILRELGYDEDQIMQMLQESDNNALQQSLLQQASHPPPAPGGTPGLNPNGQPIPRPGPGKGVKA
jgi:hypothetical protein